MEVATNPDLTTRCRTRSVNESRRQRHGVAKKINTTAHQATHIKKTGGEGVVAPLKGCMSTMTMCAAGRHRTRGCLDDRVAGRERDGATIPIDAIGRDAACLHKGAGIDGHIAPSCIT